jgi:rubrerythrin
MNDAASVDEILDFAIEREKEAQEFYTQLSEAGQNKQISKLFKEFAAMEKGHAAKLKAVKQGRKLISSAKKVADLKLADYIVPVEPTPDLDYQGTLDVAMQREKAAFKLYSNLAASSDDADLRDMFLALANEEAQHKLKIEIEYDEYILTEN